MLAIRVFFMVSLFLLPGGQILQLTGQAYADCCMCGTCKRNCTCPGKGACSWCASPTSRFQIVQNSLNGSNVTAEVEIRNVPDVRSFTNQKSSIAEKVESLMGMKSVRGNLALTFLEKIKPSLYLVCPNVSDKRALDNIIALKMTDTMP